MYFSKIADYFKTMFKFSSCKSKSRLDDVFINYDFFNYKDTEDLINQITDDVNEQKIKIKFKPEDLIININTYIKNYLSSIDKHFDKEIILDFDNLALVLTKYKIVINLNTSKLIKLYRKNVRKRTYGILYNALQSFNNKFIIEELNKYLKDNFTKTDYSNDSLNTITFPVLTTNFGFNRYYLDDSTKNNCTIKTTTKYR